KRARCTISAAKTASITRRVVRISSRVGKEGIDGPHSTDSGRPLEGPELGAVASVPKCLTSRAAGTMLSGMRRKGTGCGVAVVLLSFVRIASAAESAADADLRASFLKLKSGLTVSYVVQGDPKGPPIVLLHGVGDSWHSWELVLPHLPKTFRVYAVTLRGHG